MKIALVLAVASLALASVGEVSVQAMGAPVVMTHSQAHVMGYMCKGGGRGPQARDANAEEALTDSAWRILDTTTGRYYSDPIAGLLEFLNRTDCERSATMFNRRGLKVRYVCKIVKQ